MKIIVVFPILPIVSLLIFFGSECRADTTIEGMARSVSLFTAIGIECSKVLKVDIDKAKRYEQAFMEAGKNAFGVRRFLTVLETENARRTKEVGITGRAQWCAYQQGYLEKMGSGDVFFASKKTISADDMATTLAYLVVAGLDCGLTRNNEPLDAVVQKYGFSFKDFSPNGRYDPIMESKILKTKSRLQAHELTCENLTDTIRQSLPEIVK